MPLPPAFENRSPVQQIVGGVVVTIHRLRREGAVTA